MTTILPALALATETISSAASSLPQGRGVVVRSPSAMRSRCRRTEWARCACACRKCRGKKSGPCPSDCDDIQPGDVFLANDPYNGGGLHAQDVFIHVPVFADGKLAAWVGTSAHMVDMGGMVPGSFSTAATEVYQEAFRVPSIRLYRAGIEQEDIWAIIRNNVRMANIVEMDMRSLIAGANVVMDQLAKIIQDYGADQFSRATHELADLTESEVRRRIGELEPARLAASRGRHVEHRGRDAGRDSGLRAVDDHVLDRVADGTLLIRKVGAVDGGAAEIDRRAEEEPLR